MILVPPGVVPKSVPPGVVARPIWGSCAGSCTSTRRVGISRDAVGSVAVDDAITSLPDPVRPLLPHYASAPMDRGIAQSSLV
jgi:hypothetical protein